MHIIAKVIPNERRAGVSPEHTQPSDWVPAVRWAAGPARRLRASWGRPRVPARRVGAARATPGCQGWGTQPAALTVENGGLGPRRGSAVRGAHPGVASRPICPRSNVSNA